METMTYDALQDLDGQAHVLLDALSRMTEAVQEHDETPWEDYDGDPERGQLADEVTYRQLLAAATAHAMRTLDGSDPEVTFRLITTGE